MAGRCPYEGVMKKNNNSPQPKVSEFLREAEKEIAESTEEVKIEIPEQPEFFKTPVRFGNIPVDKLPLGCDEKEQYKKIYPRISLPFQQVEKISFGHSDLPPNRLIFGDNLHIMRMLPSNSIDLIYIDPPFFSGRNYNVIFGDQNEVRSFTDIWEGGMPGYLTWLNARLLEMKRLLKPTGSIYVHCDWHASHYIKIEMDKIFGYENFINEIVWAYSTMCTSKSTWNRKHDVLLMYSKTKDFYFDPFSVLEGYPEDYKSRFKHKDKNGYYMIRGKVVPGSPFKAAQGDLSKEYEEKYPQWTYRQYMKEGSLPKDWWTINFINSNSNERIGYPTQKPEELLIKVIKASSKIGDIIADFFCGGGTTPAVAQKLGRRWIACDISRIAISVTRDRLLRDVLSEDKTGIQQSLAKVPDISIEHWGVYEVPKLVELSNESFRNFVISAFNGRVSTGEGLIHGYKNGVPIFVGPSSQEETITKNDVVAFAKEIVTKRDKHNGTMIGWAFAPSAQEAANKLAASHAASIDFVKLELIPLESEDFREHITSKNPEYGNLLKFILPPEVRVSAKQLNLKEYEFDVSESVALNPGAKIVNVQWDFNYDGKRFVSTRGYSFIGMQDNKPVLKATYEFESAGKKQIACKVQDDEGGEKLHIFELNVK